MYRTKNYNNLKNYENLYIKSNSNTVNLKLDTNDINNIYDNLIGQAKVNNPLRTADQLTTNCIPYNVNC